MPQPEGYPIVSAGETSLRLHLVQRVLAGEAAREILGYPLDRWHLASVAWGRSAPESLRLLAWELSGDLLSVQVDRHQAWCWVEFSSGAEGDLRRRLRGYRPLAGGVAIGSPGSGPEGFRESHLE